MWGIPVELCWWTRSPSAVVLDGQPLRATGALESGLRLWSLTFPPGVDSYFLESRLAMTTRKIHLLWIISEFSDTFPSRGDILKYPVHIFLSKGIVLYLCLGLVLKSTIYGWVHNPGSRMGPSWKEGCLARPSQSRLQEHAGLSAEHSQISRSLLFLIIIFCVQVVCLHLCLCATCLMSMESRRECLDPLGKA